MIEGSHHGQHYESAAFAGFINTLINEQPGCTTLGGCSWVDLDTWICGGLFLSSLRGCGNTRGAFIVGAQNACVHSVEDVLMLLGDIGMTFYHADLSL